MNISKKLEEFYSLGKKNRWTGKGALGLALHLTRLAAEKGLPLSYMDLLTPGGGQVAGLNKNRVQSILSDYGISLVLAKESGRTNRGSLGNMRDYIDFINTIRPSKTDLKKIELWWIEKVNKHFSGKPLSVKFDSSKSLRSIVSDVLAQAAAKPGTGNTYAGTVLQHLVGAKLELVLENREEKPQHHCASTADFPTDRPGDFVIDSNAVHVTTSPTRDLIDKCQENIDSGLRPIVVTMKEGHLLFDSITKNMPIVQRIDVIEADQFIATNLLEWSGFQIKNQKIELKRLIQIYNRIVTEYETDPSLCIKM